MVRYHTGMLAGQWRQDRSGALTPRHLFDASARTEVAPAALCGATPGSVAEAISLHLDVADYARETDCAPCRGVVGWPSTLGPAD